MKISSHWIKIPKFVADYEFNVDKDQNERKRSEKKSNVHNRYFRVKGSINFHTLAYFVFISYRQFSNPSLNPFRKDISNGFFLDSKAHPTKEKNLNPKK